MVRVTSTVLRVLVVLCCASALPRAEASPQLRRAAIVSTMAEAAVAMEALIRDHTGKDLQGFKWSATYSDRDWAFSGSGSSGGQNVTVSMSGFVWGEDDQDLALTYNGTGRAFEEPIRVFGKADWIFDRARKDYLVTDFRHAMKFGANSFWGWVVGGEILVGGVVGGGGAVATAGLATGGLALGASVWIAAAGAAAGSSALVSVSNTIRVINEANQPVPASPLPTRPAAPKEGDKLDPQKGRIYVVMARDGRLFGYGPDGNSTLTGKFNMEAGRIDGVLQSK